MTKYLLPFLLFVSVGLSQDRTAKKLAAILQGADRNVVAWGVHDLFDDVGKALEDSLETKLKLGMKRNKLSYEKFDGARWSVVLINVGKLKNGYTWSVNIKRFVRTADGKHGIQIAPAWAVAGGALGTTADLKEAIDTTLDKIFLAYLELKE